MGAGFLPLIIALNYLNSLDNTLNLSPGPRKITFDFSVKNVTFIPSPLTGELEKLSNSGFTSQLICLDSAFHSNKLFCYTENTKKFTNLFKLNFLPSSNDYNPNYDEPDEFDKKMFGFGYSNDGVDNVNFPTSSPYYENSNKIKDIANLLEFRDDTNFKYGSCPVSYDEKFSGLRDPRKTGISDIDVYIEKVRHMNSCYDQYSSINSEGNIMDNIDYSISKIIAKNTAFSSSTESLINSKTFIPDLQNTIIVTSQINTTLTFVKVDRGTNIDSSQIDEFLQISPFRTYGIGVA